MLTFDAIANRNLQLAKLVECCCAMSAPAPIDDRRKRNLFAEVEAAGGAAAFVRKYGLTRDPSYFSQLKTSHRTLGEKAARRLEDECGWPEYYLDREPGTSGQPANDEVFQMIQEFPAEMRAALEDHIRTLYKAIKGIPR